MADRANSDFHALLEQYGLATKEQIKTVLETVDATNKKPILEFFKTIRSNSNLDEKSMALIDSVTKEIEAENATLSLRAKQLYRELEFLRESGRVSLKDNQELKFPDLLTAFDEFAKAGEKEFSINKGDVNPIDLAKDIATANAIINLSKPDGKIERSDADALDRKLGAQPIHNERASLVLNSANLAKEDTFGGIQFGANRTKQTGLLNAYRDQTTLLIEQLALANRVDVLNSIKLAADNTPEGVLKTKFTDMATALQSDIEKDESAKPLLKMSSEELSALVEGHEKVLLNASGKLISDFHEAGMINAQSAAQNLAIIANNAGRMEYSEIAGQLSAKAKALVEAEQKKMEAAVPAPTAAAAPAAPAPVAAEAESEIAKAGKKRIGEYMGLNEESRKAVADYQKAQNPKPLYGEAAIQYTTSAYAPGSERPKLVSEAGTIIDADGITNRVNTALNKQAEDKSAAALKDISAITQAKESVLIKEDNGTKAPAAPFWQTTPAGNSNQTGVAPTANAAIAAASVAENLVLSANLDRGLLKKEGYIESVTAATNLATSLAKPDSVKDTAAVDALRDSAATVRNGLLAAKERDGIKDDEKAKIDATIANFDKDALAGINQIQEIVSQREKEAKPKVAAPTVAAPAATDGELAPPAPKSQAEAKAAVAAAPAAAATAEPVPAPQAAVADQAQARIKELEAENVKLKSAVEKMGEGLKKLTEKFDALAKEKSQPAQPDVAALAAAKQAGIEEGKKAAAEQVAKANEAKAQAEARAVAAEAAAKEAAEVVAKRTAPSAAAPNAATPMDQTDKQILANIQRDLGLLTDGKRVGGKRNDAEVLVDVVGDAGKGKFVTSKGASEIAAAVKAEIDKVKREASGQITHEGVEAIKGAFEGAIKDAVADPHKVKKNDKGSRDVSAPSAKDQVREIGRVLAEGGTKKSAEAAPATGDAVATPAQRRAESEEKGQSQRQV